MNQDEIDIKNTKKDVDTFLQLKNDHNETNDFFKNNNFSMNNTTKFVNMNQNVSNNNVASDSSISREDDQYNTVGADERIVSVDIDKALKLYENE